MTETQTEAGAEAPDWASVADELESLLKLRSIPFAMKLFERRDDMEAIPRIRRPGRIHTLDQVVGQASRLGWTVGVTADDLVGAQCRAVVGLGGAKTDDWTSGRHMTGVWFSTAEDAARAPGGDALRARTAATRRWRSGRWPPASSATPDIALFYATPGAMIYFINGLQWSGYKRFDWSVVGESACADSWGRALTTPPAQPVDPLLRRAPLRRRARRRDADGDAAGVPRQGDRGHEGAGQERLPLSLPAIWRAAGRPRRHGGQLRAKT